MMTIPAGDLRRLKTYQILDLHATMIAVCTPPMRQSIAEIATDLSYDRESCGEVGARWMLMKDEDFKRLEIYAFCYMPLQPEERK